VRARVCLRVEIEGDGAEGDGAEGDGTERVSVCIRKRESERACVRERGARGGPHRRPHGSRSGARPLSDSSAPPSPARPTGSARPPAPYFPSRAPSLLRSLSLLNNRRGHGHREREREIGVAKRIGIPSISFSNFISQLPQNGEHPERPALQNTTTYACVWVRWLLHPEFSIRRRRTPCHRSARWAECAAMAASPCSSTSVRAGSLFLSAPSLSLLSSLSLSVPVAHPALLCGTRFPRAVLTMAYGFGDERQPHRETLELVEGIVSDYIVTMVQPRLPGSRTHILLPAEPCLCICLYADQAGASVVRTPWHHQVRQHSAALSQGPEEIRAGQGKCSALLSFPRDSRSL
jgi:hypothetical protein